MAHATLSLSWDSHRNNICNGLSSLQQNEEFVDMTLAADGHHVKVHQMVVALASPYIKQLITSAACPHPVIFLNKISYNTLSAILEYMYTGEVLVSVETLPELLQAARELHIKGLEDMDIKDSARTNHKPTIAHCNRSSEPDVEVEVSNMEEDLYFEVTDSKVHSPRHSDSYCFIDDNRHPQESRSVPETEDDMVVEDIAEDHDSETHTDVKVCGGDSPRDITGLNTEENIPTAMQYTVSNQGSLQMILNRYVYYLKHSNKNNSRQWRCVDYLNSTKCPALVVTRDDVVVQRISAHSHPFHDKRILKKVYAKAIFTAIQEAEKEGASIKTRSKDTNDE